MSAESVLTRHQVKTFRKEFTDEQGNPAVIVAKVRYDDECGNGHNSFAITGELYDRDRIQGEASAILSNGKHRWLGSCGCIHEEIAKHFPDLAPFIRWHLFDSTGPMHYIANTVYFASERDCWGKLKGEPRLFESAILFGGFPIEFRKGKRFTEWLLKEWDNRAPKIVPVEHPPDTYKFGPKFTFEGYAVKWHECPFDSQREAEQFAAAMKLGFRVVDVPTARGEGKERELDKARSAAVWPDATDQELTAPGLKERLEARLPALIAEFRASVESLGFVF